jgi:hypothetical protein
MSAPYIDINPAALTAAYTGLGGSLPSQKAKAAKPFSFPLERACDFEPPSAENWLIKGLIPKEGVGTLFGESGDYKTFTAIHLCLHIATGEMWGGRKVKHPGPVVYIAAEGARGSKKRIQGIIRAHHAGDPPIFQVSKPLNFEDFERACGGAGCRHRGAGSEARLHCRRHAVRVYERRRRERAGHVDVLVELP